MNAKSKKIIARELIYLFIGTCIYFIIFFGYNYFKLSNHKSSRKLEKEIEKITKDIPAKQLLWLDLSEKKYFNDSYDEFLIKYSKVEDQEFLFYLLKNNDLISGSFSEFRFKYFRNDLANEDAYQIYINEKGFISKGEFNLQLKDQRVMESVYKLFVKSGYKHSMTDFKNLIYGTENKPLSIYELRSKYESINELKDKLEKNKLSVFNSYYDDKFEIIALILFSILFIIRYLIHIIIWSMMQIKG